MSKRLPMMLIIVLMVFASVWSVARAEDSEISGWIQDIHKEYAMAIKEDRLVNYAQVLSLYEKILAKDPSNEDALHAVYSLGPKAILDAIGREGNTGPLVQELLRRGERTFIDRINDEEAIAGYVRDLDSTDLDTRWNAIGLLVNKYGAYAVPHVIENLSTSTVENSRTGAIVFLGKLGHDGTLAVIEALKSSDITIRQSAASVLGNSRDERALPALMALVERSGDGVDATYAREAMEKIAGSAWKGMGSAKELYVHYAERFFRNDPTMLVQPKYSTIWNWDEDGARKLVGTRVPMFAYNERLAEKFCYEALSLDPNYTPAWSLLTCSFYQQEIEATSVWKGAQGRVGKEITEDDLQSMADLAGQLYRARGLSTCAGKDLLYAALTRSLLDDMAEIAAEVLKSLYQVEDGRDFPAALESDGYAASVQLALLFPDKRVRFAAAELLLKVNTLQHFSHKDRVVPSLKQALSETATRVVLVVSDNLEFRNRMQGALEGLGHLPVLSKGRYDGLTRAREFPAQDLVIIDNNLEARGDSTSGANARLLVMDLKKDYRTKDIPILLYDSRAMDEEEGKMAIQAQFGDVFEQLRGLIYSPDPDTYSKLIDTVFEERGLEESREMAYRLAAHAADTVSQVDPQWSTYDLTNLVPALYGNLQNRPDYLVIASANCLARLADGRAEPALASQFGNTDLTVPERVAIGKALAETVKATRKVSPETMKVLAATIHEGVKEIELTTAHIIGSSSLSREARFKLYEAERPQLQK